MKTKPSEFLIELFLLLAIAIAVQTVYATIIRPKLTCPIAIPCNIDNMLTTKMKSSVATPRI